MLKPFITLGANIPFMNNVIKHKMVYYDIEIFHLALNIMFDEVICTFCM
jgi:hypothetical protein